jgi:hypothetical protein
MINSNFKKNDAPNRTRHRTKPQDGRQHAVPPSPTGQRSVSPAFSAYDVRLPPCSVAQLPRFPGRCADSERTGRPTEAALASIESRRATWLRVVRRQLRPGTVCVICANLQTRCKPPSCESPCHTMSDSPVNAKRYKSPSSFDGNFDL